MTTKKILILIFFFLSSIAAFSQTNLDMYIQQGLDNNLALKQAEFSYKKSVAALKESRGLFLPSLNLNARYTRADGGRVIDFPVGDLMNPVYRTLNQLTGQQLFPTIPNEKIGFLREEEHDTKIELVQPLFQPEIYYNYKIKSNISRAERAVRNSYARQLICDIKTAYYKYISTVKVLKILEATQKLLNENLRVSNSLYRNNKVTIDVVYRAEAELASFQQQNEEAISNEKTAKAYFNFLINRRQETEIKIDSIQGSNQNINISLDKAVNDALSHREELERIAFAEKAADSYIGLNKSGYLPNLLLSANYGFQGEKYRFTSEDDYWSASLVLRWNLFRGFQDKLKSEQSELERKKLELQKLELENQISLQVREAFYNLQVSQKSIAASELQERSAQKSFEIIDKKFKEGLASQIEYIDARSTLTNARLNNVIKQYGKLIRLAELENTIAANSSVYTNNEVEQ